MVYFVLAFLVCGAASALVLLVTLMISRTSLARTIARRSGLMAVVWLAFAGVLHLGMTRAPSFVSSLPVGILAIDLNRPVYGDIALVELRERARNQALTSAQMSSITARILRHPWWLEDAPVHQPARPQDSWLLTMFHSAQLTAPQLVAWFKIAPPPLFSAAASAPAGSDIPVFIEYGRDWTSLHSVPVQIDSVEIEELRLNGAPTDFELEELDESDATLGQFASRVAYRLRGIEAPASPWSIEIDYRLDVEPGGYRGIGPLRWTASGAAQPSR
ncbi:MAG: hypothetical protein ACF8PN_03065 [Phycisphaerales bacterium]